MHSTTVLFALALSSLVGSQRSGEAANGCLLADESARFEDHNQMSVSLLVLYSAPSVNHLTLAKIPNS